MKKWKSEELNVQRYITPNKLKRYRWRFSINGVAYSKGGYTRLETALECAAAERSRLQRLAVGIVDNSAKLSDIYDKWIAHIKLHLKQNTVDSYVFNMMAIRAFWKFERCDAGAITPSAWDDYQRQRKQQGMSDETIRTEYRRFHRMFAWAVSAREIAHNPLDHVKPLVCRKTALRRPLTEQEYVSLISPHEHPNGGNGTQPCRARGLWIGYGESGMRLNELANLMVADCDLKRQVIIVQPHDDWSPKTKASCAEIPMTRLLFNEITKRIVAIRQSGNDSPHALIFPDANNVRRKLHACLKAAGIDPSGINVHSLRYTYGKRLFDRGIDIKTIQRMMRHKSIRVTMDIYLKDAGDMRTAAKSLDAPLVTTEQVRKAE